MPDPINHLLEHHIWKHPWVETALDRGFRILLIIAGVLVCAKLIRTISRQIMKAARPSKDSGSHAREREKRLATVVNLVDTTLRVLVYGAAILMILRELGLDITPLLTGAGIAGVALGFGSQSLVKDVISGFFLLIEDQIRIGDVIKINNGLSGAVERMELRVTGVRDGDGTLHIIPNGEIKSVSNMTYEFAQAVVSIPIPYQSDLAKVNATLSKVADEFDRDPKWKGELSGKPEFVGITEFQPAFMMVQIVVKTKPHSRWSVARELRNRVILELDHVGINLMGQTALS